MRSVTVSDTSQVYKAQRTQFASHALLFLTSRLYSESEFFCPRPRCIPSRTSPTCIRLLPLNPGLSTFLHRLSQVFPCPVPACRCLPVALRSTVFLAPKAFTKCRSPLQHRLLVLLLQRHKNNNRHPLLLKLLLPGRRPPRSRSSSSILRLSKGSCLPSSKLTFASSSGYHTRRRGGGAKEGSAGPVLLLVANALI